MSEFMIKEIVELRRENEDLKKEIKHLRKMQAPPKNKQEMKDQAFKLIADAKGLVEELRDGYQESADNTQEYFPSRAEEFQEHANACGEAYGPCKRFRGGPTRS